MDARFIAPAVPQTRSHLPGAGATSRPATRCCRSSTTSCGGWRARFWPASARDHTLQATALVHEAYLRLIDQRQVDWTNRAQFVGVAAVMMRRILVNHARDRAADKRGGEAETGVAQPGARHR